MIAIITCKRMCPLYSMNVVAPCNCYAGYKINKNSDCHNILTCSWEGNGPGSMPLAEEYNLGVCLFRWHRIHSVVGGRSWIPGKDSEHIEHLGEFRLQKYEIFSSSFVQSIVWRVVLCWDKVLFRWLDAVSLLFLQVTQQPVFHSG